MNNSALHRDVLFGILAAESNLVARDMMHDALRVWIGEEDARLGQILLERGAITQECHDHLTRQVARLLVEDQDASRSIEAEPSPPVPSKTITSIEVRRGQAETVVVFPTVNDNQSTIGWSMDSAGPRIEGGESSSTGLRYHILRPLARGGLGEVFVGLDEELKREVALKLIQEQYCHGEQYHARFMFEAEVTASLEHPGIVPVHGLGRFPDGRPYYAMRLIRGEPFKTTILQFHDREDFPSASARSLAFRELLRRFLAVCDVIAYAHSRGIIHRDLKPSNMLLGAYGETLVVDWGLAKVLNQPEPGPPSTETHSTESRRPVRDSLFETLPGLAIGTPQFMSPEQAAGELERLGPATDVYGLGATLYFLLTGEPPFDLSELDAILAEVQAGRIIPPTQVNKEVPPALEAICLKAMARDPEQRYSSPQALASDLKHWLADEPVSVYREPFSTRITRWGRRHRSLAVGIGVLLVTAVLGLALGAILLGHANRQTEEQRVRAEQAATVLERQLYINRINLAYRESLDHNVTRALELLELCPTHLRGWEWSFVRRLCHQERSTFSGHSQCVNALAFSPDGTQVVSGAGKPFYASKPEDPAELFLWDVASRRILHRFPGIQGSVHALAFSPDGAWIASGSGYYGNPAAGQDHGDRGRLTLWDVATGRLLLDQDQPDLNVLDVAFSPDGSKLAAALGIYSNDETKGRLQLWDLASGALEFDQPMQLGGANALAFTPDGQRIAVADSNVVELWDLETQSRVRQFQGHTGWVYTLAFSPDGTQLASAGWDSTLRLWDPASGEELIQVDAHQGHVLSAAFSPDGQILATSGDDSGIRFWNPRNGRPLRSLRGHATLNTGVRDLAFDSQGQLLASAGGDQTVKLWGVNDEQPLTLRDHDGWVTSLAFSSDDALLATGSGDHTIAIREARTGKRLRTLPSQDAWILCVAFQPQRRILASGNAAGRLTLWNAETGELLWDLPGHASEVRSVAFSPDGQLLASASGGQATPQNPVGEVILWDMTEGKPRQLLRKQTDRINQLTFSPDGTRLALACGARADPLSGNGILLILEVPSGRELQRFEVPGGDVQSVAFSPLGDLLATGGKARMVRLWDLEQGQMVQTLTGHVEEILSLAFSPDGRLLASGGFDKQIKLWDFETGVELLGLRDHDGGVVALAFSPDGHRLVSGSTDRTARIWTD